jgi:hypothetical protein
VYAVGFLRSLCDDKIEESESIKDFKQEAGSIALLTIGN